jgi:hypothetical protein
LYKRGIKQWNKTGKRAATKYGQKGKKGGDRIKIIQEGEQKVRGCAKAFMNICISLQISLLLRSFVLIG